MNAGKRREYRAMFDRRPDRSRHHFIFSAFICGTSAFICVSSLSPQSAAAVFFNGETLKAERREAISPWMKRAVIGVPS
jgi:hypothetical protein